MDSILTCMDCGKTYPINERVITCPACGGLLDVTHDLDALRGTVTHELFDQRLGSWNKLDHSGVWRYRELILPGLPEDAYVTRGEGNTTLYTASPKLADYAGVAHLQLKHEGENPTGSFKDRGMAGGVTQAQQLGVRSVICASTGNTSASMASFAAICGLQAMVFFPVGYVALGKIAQSVAYGALSVQVEGDFDDTLALVWDVAQELPVYLLNSYNPFRLEGQKTIMIEMLHQRGWRVPDWIVVPGGNLGNSSAFGKALVELRDLGLIDRLPRIAIIQAEGANPLYRSYIEDWQTRHTVRAQTIATAIRIGNPANFHKAHRTLDWTNGVVTIVDDQAIMDAKAQIDAAGIGCEPASAASVAGVRRLVDEGTIAPDADVVSILTGHLLKDPDAVLNYHAQTLDGIESTYANHMKTIKPSLDAVAALLTE
ncbi:MAG: threonine synthase [Anaerolineae bacterium]|nr:threonine synthase [Anaerolineae bacterium]